MASMINDDVPVGRSFEVYAANEPEAAMSARVLATQAGIIAGNLLFIEQVEAGRYEVVLEEVYAVAPDEIYGPEEPGGTSVWIAGAPQ